MARSKIETTRDGYTLLDGKLVGKRKFLVKGEFSITLNEELILLAHDKESAEDRFTELCSKKAKQLGGTIDTVFVDFAEPEEYFSG
tara:strand:+ start:1126 stop:1383 length:258 start_codon:yes stop_codon:yes gene_type:complete